MMKDGSDGALLARDMIDVHGAEASTIARRNARDAALAGQPALAKSWIGVLAIIQRQQVGKTSPLQDPGPSDAKSQKETAMHISLIESLSGGFKKWSDANRPYDHDDGAADAPPIPISDPPADATPVDDPATLRGQPHHPWLVPGAGSSF